jgi:hypothetical protein
MLRNCRYFQLVVPCISFVQLDIILIGKTLETFLIENLIV